MSRVDVERRPVYTWRNHARFYELYEISVEEAFQLYCLRVTIAFIIPGSFVNGWMNNS